MSGPAGSGGFAAGPRDAAALATVLGLVATLAAALVLQLGFGEIPCPLCLIERVGMFGVGLCLVARFRGADRARATGAGLAFALLLLVVSVRQVLNDIVPRPGHAYVGSAVLGLHMPVWAVLVAVAAIVGLAVDLLLSPRDPAPARLPSRLARALALALVLLGLVNLGLILLQCGAGACHTDGYALLR